MTDTEFCAWLLENCRNGELQGWQAAGIAGLRGCLTVELCRQIEAICGPLAAV